MLGMPVSEMLTRLSSYELTEWQAFERAYGPLGNGYIEDALAMINDQLQALNWMTGAQFEENPIPEPRRSPRPSEFYVGRHESSDADTTNDVAAFDREFE